MKIRIRSVLFIVLCIALWPGVAWPQSDEPTLGLVVKLDGKTLNGLEYIRQHWADAPVGKRESNAAKLMDANTITFKRGTTLPMAVYLIQPNGTLKDITGDPKLDVQVDPVSMQFQQGKLTATPVDKTGHMAATWPTSVSVAYSPTGKNGPFGFDEFGFLLTP